MTKDELIEIALQWHDAEVAMHASAGQDIFRTIVEAAEADGMLFDAVAKYKEEMQ